MCGPASDDEAAELHVVGGERAGLVGENVRHLAELVEERALPHLRRLLLLLVVHVQVLEDVVARDGVDEVTN